MCLIDFDKISREICNPHEPCLKELTEYFGCDIIDDSGFLIRKKLGEIVFADKQKLAQLNLITHKYIMQKANELIADNSNKNIVFDCPLLFETNLDKKCSCTVSILCDEETQINRIMQRDGISLTVAKGRLSSQHTNEYFEQKSSFCIYNNSTQQEFCNKLEKLLEEIYADYSK